MNITNVLIVGGTFNDEGGKPSGYIRRLTENLISSFPFPAKPVIHNGGYFNNLSSLAEEASKFEVIIWLADVPNNKPKLLPFIKVNNPKALLVIAKNNLDNKYDAMLLIARALKVKANLFVEFNLGVLGFIATVMDPLGNAYCFKEHHIPTVAKTLANRIDRLLKFHRVPTQSVGPAIVVPNPVEFFEIARIHAEKFHRLIHATNQDRFLGNLSFRCEAGFPSFREENILYVSKRNIDKRDIGPEGFIGVDLNATPPITNYVGFFGDVKPSVDTPILVRLYKRFPEVRYSIHSHVYIASPKSPMTSEPIPCGSIEEAEEIEKMILSKANFAVNLKGHGSIVLAKDASFFKEINYISRTFPEFHE